ncbi:ATP-binding protein [Leptothoe spongobia]|uniref:ATP-binding protein n=1 Tax=Leptothoe spongobia TAU-MAC 1115 TaxID=1967444 RepID=A0A947DGP2_9CYAN|nr:ATP-binding protein [Leptothoe spongobia]MBT9316248.1 ATP-binding protein [Leptothoe spongobia TAU-MAC 1115]
MDFDFLKFFDACDPSRTLIIGNQEDRQYYTDFASVRGGKIIELVKRTILLKARTNQPTCQLFTGHIGCGKSTELRRLQSDLEAQGFHVVYFESTEDLDIADVDITDIFLSIIRQVTESLKKVNIQIKPSYFQELFNEIADFLQTPVELSYENEFALPMGLGKLAAQTKESPKLRSRLRQYLEPRTSNILEVLNRDVLGVATEKLKLQGKQGLVVIIDNLDRIDNRSKFGGARTQPEYLFVDRGDQLRQLNCHVVYTIPLVLLFSNEYQALTNRFGGGVKPHVLPMVPVLNRDQSSHDQGLALLRQMVMARAFPTTEPEERLEHILRIFDSQETLDRLCCVSGGHIRTLLGILYRCLQEDDPPISRDCLERAIREHRDGLTLGITDDEWELLHQVIQQQTVRGEEGHQTLLRSLFVFEYYDEQGRWFDINPALRETEKFRQFNGNS